MLQNKQNLLLLLIVLLIGFNIFNTNSIRTDVKGYKEKIEALQTKIDSAQVINEKIDIKIDSVKDNVVNITKEIHHIDNNISVIKQQTNEKVNIVDTYTASELEQFFTDRYDKGSN
jgi:predicted  nucleic acid-binding Zn-ribbon protein